MHGNYKIGCDTFNTSRAIRWFGKILEVCETYGLHFPNRLLGFVYTILFHAIK